MKLTEQEQDALDYSRKDSLRVGAFYTKVMVALVDRLLAYNDKAEKAQSTFSKLSQLARSDTKTDPLSPEDRAYVESVRGKKPLSEYAIGLLSILDKVTPVQPSVSFLEAYTDMCKREDAVYTYEGDPYKVVDSGLRCMDGVVNASLYVAVVTARMQVGKWTKVA